MAILGEDFRGGFFRRIFAPVNPLGFKWALAMALALLLLHFLLQFLISQAIIPILFDSAFEVLRVHVKAGLISVFPASLAVAAAAWALARRGGADPFRVLNLRWPNISLLGWIALIAGFLVFMYAAIFLVVVVFGIDAAQYTPGPDGRSPETGSAGAVKEAMFDIANEPWLFALVFPSIALGAPIAEELIFRGQLFSSLSQTRLGLSGTTLVTAALWAGLHFSEPMLSVGIIFIMGLVFGWMMYRFGSLWLTMACHAAWNALHGLLIFSAMGTQT